VSEVEQMNEATSSRFTHETRHSHIDHNVSDSISIALFFLSSSAPPSSLPFKTSL